MNEPLKGKGQIDETTRLWLDLRWFKKDGTEYKGDVAFDGDYNAFGKGNISLEGRYFDDGKEVKQTVFAVESVKSALEWMIQIHEEKIEEIIREIDLVGMQYDYYKWIDPLIHRIEIEYESIMILEVGLSDVV